MDVLRSSLCESGTIYWRYDDAVTIVVRRRRYQCLDVALLSVFGGGAITKEESIGSMDGVECQS